MFLFCQQEELGHPDIVNVGNGLEEL